MIARAKSSHKVIGKTKKTIKNSQTSIFPPTFQDEVFIGGEDENFEGALLPEDSDNVKRCLQELKKVEAEQVI